MSKIINLLEKMGQNAEFRYADAEQLARLMADTDPALLEAIVAADQHAIELLLGTRSNIVCAIYPADEPKQDEPEDDDQDADKIHLKQVG